MLAIIKNLINKLAILTGAKPLLILAALTIVGILLVFLVFGALFGQCGHNRQQKRLDDINAQISNANIGAEIINAQKQNSNAVTRNAEARTNEAKANLEKARNGNFNVSGSDLDKMAANYK